MCSIRYGEETTKENNEETAILRLISQHGSIVVLTTNVERWKS